MYTLQTMLDDEKFDCLMDDNRTIRRTADVVSMEVHRMGMQERDLAAQRLREDYGISIGEKKAVQRPCRGCVYFKECGDNMRTMTCAGRLTKRQMAQTRNGR